MSAVLGIDPGQSTGAAFFQDGELVWLRTVEPREIERLIRDAAPDRVVYEDSRLESKVWIPAGPRAAALKIARNIGQIDAWCSLIFALCAEHHITAHGISPRAKGAKLNAAQFKAVTGWGGKSNQHERDGAMVAWPYRRARGV